MSKKAKIIVIVACVAGALLTALVAAFVVREWLFSREYVPGDDEFALFFVLDTEEDVGLIVFDYTANGRKFGGGVSNADRTPLKKGEVVIDTRSREELECEGTTRRRSQGACSLCRGPLLLEPPTTWSSREAKPKGTR